MTFFDDEEDHFSLTHHSGPSLVSMQTVKKGRRRWPSMSFSAAFSSFFRNVSLRGQQDYDSWWKEEEASLQVSSCLDLDWTQNSFFRLE